ncbi:MAG: DUF1853 family protein, partial [Lacisediminimonas sp.]|nr:DUF1853 family protein [Lacisediminimonas sp.]
AWLIDAPDLLDPLAPQWRGRIASFAPDGGNRAAHWLRELDRNPEPLHRLLAVQRFTRLGRYAEQLLTWYFRQHGTLVAQGLQVREGGITVGEFDFLLREGERLVHWEMATKVYLLQSPGSEPASAQADYFVGPNLADNLGAKMSKIIERQLGLSTHPAALAALTEPVQSVAALIKGWLFYPACAQRPSPSLGLAADHCRGFWTELGGLRAVSGERYQLLERLQWLTPVVAELAGTMNHAQLQASLLEIFRQQAMPVMIAIMEEEGGRWIEAERGFIVPDDWSHRAGQYAGATSSLRP